MATTSNTSGDTVGITATAVKEITKEITEFVRYVDLKTVMINSTSGKLEDAIKGSNVKAEYYKLINTFRNEIKDSTKDMQNLAKSVENAYNQYNTIDKQSTFSYGSTKK